MASVKAIIAKLLNCDYVIEEGTSGDWTYRKWKSGIAECWAGYSIGSFAPTSSFGGTYYRILDKAFPTGFFNETPKFAEVDTYWDTGNSWGSARALSKDTIQYSVFKNSNSPASAQMRIYAIGTWKSIGGGYFLAAFSAIERWWSHADCQGLACQDIRHPATNRHKLHNCRWYWHLLGQQSNHGQFCTNGTTTDNVFNDDWNGMCGQLCLLVKRYIRRANRIRPKVYESYKPIREGFNQHSAERILFGLDNNRQSITPERGCIAC